MLTTISMKKAALLAYIRNKAGAIALIFALAAPVVVGTAGLAMETTQAYLVRERLSHSLDAAALASASLAKKSQSEAYQRLKDFMALNFPPERIGTVYNLEMQVHGDDITVSAYAAFQTSFLRVLGFDTIDVYAESTVRREVRGLEVALVLDVTGSMRGSKITTLREATKDFINIIYNRVSSTEYLRIGLVPYAITVNLGDEADTYADNPVRPGGQSVAYSDNDDSKWAGCVMARPYPDDTLDKSDLEYATNWKAYWWEHDSVNDWDSAQGGQIVADYPNPDNSGCNERRYPNLGCPVKNPIVPLTNDRQKLDNAADKITHWCRGGTNGNIGMMWGWRVLSDKKPFDQGASYNDPLWRKAIVMMTDGENTFYQQDYSAYGFIKDGNMKTSKGFKPERYDYDPVENQDITNKSIATDEANNRFIKICDKVKSLGITVYTVTFGSGIIGTDTEKFYKDCATDHDKYYPAANNQELKDAFKSISEELSNLHISG